MGLSVSHVVFDFPSQMSEHYWTPQSNVSNETSTGKTFQRTISAQVRCGFVWPGTHRPGFQRVRHRSLSEMRGAAGSEQGQE